MRVKPAETQSLSEKLEKCQEWLENCTINENQSICSECQTESDSNFDCSSTDYSECSSQSQIVSRTDRITTIDNNKCLESIIGQNQNVYENIIVNKSKRVHLGNVTVINGPIYIKESQKTKKNEDIVSDVKLEHLKLAEAHIRWVDRRAWLAQPQVEEYEKLQKPAKYVIICHSATEDASTHWDNIVLVRHIQQFHIECRKWSDIAYNFMIACDGYTYKGRGWGIRGAHSFRYNAISVGICFVGTFCTKLPPQIALEQAKGLIRYGVEYGVEQGEIDKDYALIGNCQVSSSKSPGECLFEEIQTWDHYDPSITLENPSSLIEAA
ncbi:peptidoglycan-recognition protein LE-like [Atheta coriaria]|uniref:peptidoglycan-recognition protein LE-like n=1 Tax=Dalotia coriaria TaxID=877792 RepID=UPI0031F429DD